MAHYNILSLSQPSLWHIGLEQGFMQLARTNPGWTFSMTSKAVESDPKPNLYLLDLTAEQEAYPESVHLSGTRVLALVHASQRRMIKSLLQTSRCSVLCVDEYHCNFREIVEASARNKRFLSPLIREISRLTPAPVSKVALTETESKILDYIREGKNGVEISQALFRSQKTISSHKRNIMRKFGVRNDLALRQKLRLLSEQAA